MPMPPGSFNVAVLLRGIGIVVSGTYACARTISLSPLHWLGAWSSKSHRKPKPAATECEVRVVKIFWINCGPRLPLSEDPASIIPRLGVGLPVPVLPLDVQLDIARK